MRLRAEDITPVTKIKNEELWIFYVLRPLFKTFGRFIMYDTGSNDRTKGIAKETARKYGGELTLLEHDHGDDACAIGNAPNVLREMCPTHWMMLVDGDELWTEEQLEKLLSLEVGSHKTVLMATARNLTEHGDGIMERDGFSADRLFAPEVRWNLRTDYPFESHDLESRVAAGKVEYLPVWFWHVRHLIRSTKDKDAFFRQRKRDYFPYSGPYKEIPEKWFGEMGPYPNPYLKTGPK